MACEDLLGHEHSFVENVPALKPFLGGNGFARSAQVTLVMNLNANSPRRQSLGTRPRF